MLVRALEMKDFCQHENTRLEFSSGVNILTGENGSGKSNLIRAIQFALFGEITGTTRLDENIRHGQNEATVSLWFEHDGREGEIKRVLKRGGTRASLSYDKESLRAATAVNSRINEMLSVDAKMADEFVFIHQGRLNAMIDATTAKRKDLFHLLIGTDVYEKLRTGLSLERNQHAEIQVSDTSPSQIGDEILAAEMQVINLSDEMTVLDSKIKAIDGESLQSTITRVSLGRTRLACPRTGLAACEATLSKTTDRLLEVKGLQQVDTVIREQQAAVLSDLDEQRKHAETVIATADNVRKMNQERQRLSAQADQLSSEHEARQAPTDMTEPDLAATEKLLTELQSTLAQYQQSVKQFSENGTCPACGTTVIIDAAGETVDIAKHVEELNRAIAEISPNVRSLQGGLNEQRTAWNTYQRDLAGYQQWYSSWEKQVTSVTDSLERLGPEIEVQATDEHQEIIGRYQDTKTIVRDLDAALREYDREIATLEQREKQTRESITELTTLRDGLVDTGPLQVQLTEWRQMQQSRANLNGQHQQLLLNVTNLRKRKEQVEQLIAREKSQRVYRQLLENASEVLHRDKYPAALAQAHIAKIRRGWNEMLNLFEVPFSADLNDDLSSEQFLELSFPFATGVCAPYQLSGGQKCAASLSFLVAVNRQFIKDMGMLVLDEPTYGLNAAKLELLPEFMRQVQGYASAAGVQILMVTHEERLFADFDTVINLNELVTYT